MGLMMKIAIPNEPCNSMRKAGTFGPTMGRILDSIKPEAASFTTIDGQRGGFIVVDVDDASKVPFIVEPPSHAFEASIEIGVAMTAEDLQTADDDIPQEAKIYG